MQQHKREVRDGMRIDWDIPIEMDDGTALRADVSRPGDDGRYPVIMTHGPYAKGLAFGVQRVLERDPASVAIFAGHRTYRPEL